MDRVVSEGSVWLLDPSGRYCRMPRHEGPREDPSWGAIGSVLEDFLWQEFIGVDVVARLGAPCLRIVPAGREDGLVTGQIVEGLNVAERYAADWPCDTPGHWPRWTRA